MRAILPLLLLAGCAGTPAALQPYDSKYLTVTHGTGRFDSGADYAARYCAQARLKARHLGTDTPPQSRSLSRFECVAD